MTFYREYTLQYFTIYILQHRETMNESEKLKVDRYLSFYQSELGKNILLRELGLVKSALPQGSTVLDVGCGPGAFEQILEGYFSIVALDPDISFLSKGYELSNSMFVRGVAEHLPFKDECFEGVMFITSMEFIKNPETAVSEVYRVLKENGIVFAIMLNPESSYFRERVKRKGYSSGARRFADDVYGFFDSLFEVHMRKSLLQLDEGDDGMVDVLTGRKY